MHLNLELLNFYLANVLQKDNTRFSDNVILCYYKSGGSDAAEKFHNISMLIFRAPLI